MTSGDVTMPYMTSYKPLKPETGGGNLASGGFCKNLT